MMCLYFLLVLKLSISTQVIIFTEQAYNYDGRTYAFSPIPKTFCCDNIYRFTFNQKYDNKSRQIPYLMYVSLQGQFNMSIGLIEGDPDGMTITMSNYSCTNSCFVTLTNNCVNRNSYGLAQLNITGLLPITYNIFCNSNYLNSPFQYGLIVLIVVCIVQIVLAALYQQANAFDNRGIYIQYKLFAIICVGLIGGSLIIIFFANSYKDSIRQIIEIFSFILGIFGVTVCTSQFVYWTGFKFMRCQFVYRRLVIRFMDILGLAIGAFLLLSWITLDKNWIISDIIYTTMFFTTVKLVKIGSMKMAILMFVSIFIIFLMFIITDTQITHSYFNSNLLSYLNSPFFILFPTINYIPNQVCSWFFISSIAFPAMVLSYLVRFDYSRSTKVYTFGFVCLFIICSAGWLILSIFLPFVLPYDLIISVIYMAAIMLFANRRGQLTQLWHGHIYDSMHKHKQLQDNQLKQIMNEDQKVRYTGEWLKVKMSNVSASSTANFRDQVPRPSIIQMTQLQSSSKSFSKDDGI